LNLAAKTNRKMDPDFEEDEEYIYEEDGEYDEEADEDFVDEDYQPDETPGSRRESAGTGQNITTPMSGEKKSDRDREIIVPNDSFNIMVISEVEPIMHALVADVASLLDLNTDVTQALLQHNKWNREKLIDAFFADPEKVMLAAGLDMYVDTSDTLSAQAQSNPPSPVKLFRNSSKGSTTSNSNGKNIGGEAMACCRICYDETSNLFSMGCGHKFCRSCYTEYLASLVGDGQSCIIGHCPEFKCTQLVTPSVFHALLGDRQSGVVGAPGEADTNSPLASVGARTGKLTAQYDTYYVRNFIETCKDMKYCPAPGCDKVAVGSGVTTVRCSCGYPFCMRCGEEAHDPCSCSQLADWAMKCMNESETANWILANTRKCPACNARIEKNQGCNHMTCRLCKHDFCWICMGSWAEHGQQTGGFYKCNRFMPAEVKSIISAIDKAKADLDRYLHYYQRYHGHDSALKYASAQRVQAEARMVEQQEAQKSSWIDVQFLKQAAEQVIDCRRVLKYTYVLGFFLPDGSPEKQLFEHHQEMLEKNTERLQEYTELNLDLIDRTQVVNLTRVTEKFMSSLLASMTGGVVSLDSDLMNLTAPTAESVSSSAPNSAIKVDAK